MKKIITLAIFVIALCTFSNAQNYEVIDITSQFEFGIHYQYCATIDSIVINQDGTCQNPATWLVGNDQTGDLIFEGSANHITITPDMGEQLSILYTDCYVTSKWFIIEFTDFENVPEPWTEDVHWLNHGEQIQLQAPYSNTLNYLWSDGSTGTWFNVTGPGWSGKIWLRMYNQCGSVSDTINVYYNGDLTMATVDPETDNIRITWEVNPLLAEYIESLVIYRNGYNIATVPYAQGQPYGQYIDAISGSATSRSYTCKVIAKTGFICDVFSAPKPSIHMVYTVGYFGTVEMQFNDVSTNYADLYQYYISQWNAGEITHVDSIMPSRLKNGETVKTALGYVTMRDGVINYSAPESFFSDGYLIVEADLQTRNRDAAGKFLSNRSENTVGIHEVEGRKTFNIYPNPSDGVFNIKSDGEMTLTIYNLMGQTVATGRTENGVFNTERLSPGVYFVKTSEGHTQKVVVQ